MNSFFKPLAQKTPNVKPKDQIEVAVVKPSEEIEFLVRRELRRQQREDRAL